MSSAGGLLIAIVGPSGSGKDSLIRWLQENNDADFPLRFVRRYITREDVDGHEDSIAVTHDDFDKLKKDGELAVSWEAHGLKYGLPRSSLDDVIAGHLVVVNGSRQALLVISEAFPNMLVINLQVERSELVRRLSERGRENPAEVAKRLGRSDIRISDQFDCVTIDNSGPLDHTGNRVLKAVKNHLAHRAELAGAQS
ncbi:MAG: phosphonate metabolism protein/1,5-bisphosphokinase (PRPP-forming) PhnN [Pseudomonadota bacterium]